MSDKPISKGSGGMNISDLKPCPLCGGQAEFEYTPWDEDTETGDDGTGWIECQTCHLTLAGYDRDEADRRWNTRANTGR